MTCDRTAAARQRRRRERLRAGIRQVTIEVGPQALDAMLKRGLIHSDDLDDDLGAAIEYALHELLFGVTP